MKPTIGEKNSLTQLMRIWDMELSEVIAEIESRGVQTYIKHDIIKRASPGQAFTEDGKKCNLHSPIKDRFGNNRNEYEDFGVKGQEWLLANPDLDPKEFDFSVRVIAVHDGLIHVEVNYSEELPKSIFDRKMGEIIIINSGGSLIGGYGAVEPQYVYVKGEDLNVSSDISINALKLIGVMMNEIIAKSGKPNLKNGDKPHLQNFKEHILELAESQGIESRGLGKIHDKSFDNGFLPEALKVLEDNKK